VKTARIWLLVLLAVLLPIRGAVAAAMLCPASAAAGHAERHLHQHTTQTPDHAHMQHAHGSGEHHDGGKPAGPSDKCGLCCDFCSVTPLVGSLPGVPAPQALASISFPDLRAAAPSFVSDGQERPPRSS
jgi:hypothetical protein